MHVPYVATLYIVASHASYAPTAQEVYKDDFDNEEFDPYALALYAYV